MTRIRTAWEDFKAWRRGEKRTTPYGVRGRVYKKIEDIDGARRVNHNINYRVTARVIRADGRPDEHYTLTR